MGRRYSESRQDQRLDDDDEEEEEVGSEVGGWGVEGSGAGRAAGKPIPPSHEQLQGGQCHEEERGALGRQRAHAEPLHRPEEQRLAGEAAISFPGRDFFFWKSNA